MTITRRQFVAGSAMLASEQTIAHAQPKFAPMTDQYRLHRLGIQGSSHLRIFHGMTG